VLPHETIEMTALVPVPKLPGPAILRVTLLQDGIAWFDELDRANCVEGLVEIQPAGELAQSQVPTIRERTPDV